jgi:hypothetical protein
MGRYKKNTNRNYKRINHYAKKHIAEAERLSSELGGVDKDVKNWFFARSEEELTYILEDYKGRYGAKAYDYALVTIPKWKSGRTKMSGVVAERLFNILPEHMPLESKYSLVDSLWKHAGPQKKILIEIGSEADIEKVISIIKEEVMSLSTIWEIPNSLNKRFKWLGRNDTTTYQNLLSYILDKERQLAVSILEKQIPIIQYNFKSNWREVSQSINYVIEVGKQSVELQIIKNKDLVNVTEWKNPYNRKIVKKVPFDWKWLILLGIVIIVLVKT